MISHVSVVGLIDIEHMQSVIKVFFFFPKLLLFSLVSYQKGMSQMYIDFRKKSADLR